MKSEPRSVLEAVHIILLLVCEENTSVFLVHSNSGFLGMGYTCKCILLQVVLATLLMSSKCWARIMWFISYWTLVAICSGDEPGYFQLQPGWAHTVSWWNMPVISFNLWQTLTLSFMKMLLAKVSLMYRNRSTHAVLSHYLRGWRLPKEAAWAFMWTLLPDQISVSPFASIIILSNPLDLSVPQFPHLYKIIILWVNPCKTLENVVPGTLEALNRY